MKCQNLDSVGVSGPTLGAESFSPVIGGFGGSDYGSTLTCPPGSALTGLQLRLTNIVDQLGVVCTDFSSGNEFFSNLVGNQGTAAQPSTFRCPGSTTATGFQGRQGALLDQVQLVCRSLGVGRSFTVDTVAPGAPTLVQPASGDVLAGNRPFFEWTPSSGDVVEYLLQVTSGGTFNPHLVINEVIPHPGTGHQAVDPLADGPYLWRVIAGDLALNTASSLVQPFTVETPEGRVLLQGRGPTRNAGTEITLFQNRVQVGTPLLTQPDGSFAVGLGAGVYKAAATHPGWLSDTLFFTINATGPVIDLGTTTLPAGDADGDNDVDSRDLQLFQRGLNQAPRPGTFTDVNGDGITDIVEIAYAGRNVGRRGLAPVVAPAGMVSWWPADGNARDIIGDNDGTLLGNATFALGKVGQGFSFDRTDATFALGKAGQGLSFFDGTGDLVLVSGDNANLNILGDVTVDVWAKRTGFSPGVPFATMVIKGAGVIGIAQTADVPTAYGLFFDDGNRLNGVFETADGSNVFVIGPVVTDTNFHHYAYVRMGNTHKLFMDGVMVSTDTFAEGPGDTSGLPLTIGAIRTDETPTGFRHHFVGVIDEVEIFDRALSEAEIRSIFQAGSAGKLQPAPPSLFLHSVTSKNDNNLRVIDPTNGSTVFGRPISLAGETVNGATGLATHPLTGELFGLLKIGSSRRELVTIDPFTGVATSIGNTQDRLVALAFDSNATLYAVDAGAFLWATDRGDLFQVTTTGVATLIGTVDHQVKGLAWAPNQLPKEGDPRPIGLGDDEVSGPIPLGFSFNYFGTDRTEIFVSSNGFLTVLPGQNSGCCSGEQMPSIGTPNGTIAGWWADLNPGGGGTIHRQTPPGDAPNRRLIVQFTNVPHCCNDTPVTFQFKLFEGTNVIEVHYENAPSNGGTHSAGVENEDGTIGVSFHFGTGYIPDSTAVRYTPVGPNGFTVLDSTQAGGPVFNFEDISGSPAPPQPLATTTAGTTGEEVKEPAERTREHRRRESSPKRSR